ncbi:MAG TPA: glycosyltransferase [Ferruginibacter sp.]|nr:glycosyltransferase [Ferruginibacter sp.]
MRLLIIGSDKIFAIENFYVKYINAEGVIVHNFPAQTLFYDYYGKNVFNKLLFKANLSWILIIINKKFKQEVIRFKPDAILVFKGMEIFPDSLNWVKKRGIKLINYNPDNPFLFSGRGSGNRNIKNSIKLYDLHLTYNSDIKREMEDKYKISTAILPFGFDVSNELFEKCGKQQEIIKVCFLGNPDKHRSKFIHQLAEKGTSIDVYGNDWQKFIDHPNVNILQPIYGEDFWFALRKYRVQLNLMRPHNPDSHNMRSFEIPAIGGIQLAPLTADHKLYFEPEKEIFLYKNVEDCVFQIKKILALPVNEANVIREQARQRSVSSAYSYKDRSKQALQQIEKLYE